jgi:hypothetical protein
MIGRPSQVKFWAVGIADCFASPDVGKADEIAILSDLSDVVRDQLFEILYGVQSPLLYREYQSAQQ